MTCWGVIGGSGLQEIDGLVVDRAERVETPFGSPSSELVFGQLNGVEVVFLPRHGHPHTIPPHKVNYRANIWALKQVGVDFIVAVAAVGGIHQNTGPGVIVIPEQLIDYSYGRAHTFFEDNLDAVTHIDFSNPYEETLRQSILLAAKEASVPVLASGCYGVTQGPRLETAKEIDRMEQDGCSLVGMTGMPEAGLARELGLAYASVSVVANYAAGRGDGEITMAEIEVNLVGGMAQVCLLLGALLGSSQ
ncbi:MAG: S-methyl-5'-thioinosine phosphorylase [Methylococcales bacterium]|jgi:5'-methylthioinosine phosphorylase|nr:S-methyl-5'-thioinosine phosphorylase [Methylococcales bacterium]MBT7444151.1 S-methyl-5'-thioinosine phosphorylase [Methylococcales bacterium]